MQVAQEDPQSGTELRDGAFTPLLAARRHDIRVDSSVAAAEMAAAGKRFALLQKQFLAPYLTAGRLVVALDRDMRIDQGLYLLQPETKHQMKPQAILLRDWLIDVFQE